VILELLGEKAALTGGFPFDPTARVRGRPTLGFYRVGTDYLLDISAPLRHTMFSF